MYDGLLKRTTNLSLLLKSDSLKSLCKIAENLGQVKKGKMAFFIHYIRLISYESVGQDLGPLGMSLMLQYLRGNV